MRFIFTDEAGVSQHEEYTVVAGIVVEADEQLVRAENHVREIFSGIPVSIQEDFVYSAKAVWAEREIRNHWPLEGRLRFLEALMGVPMLHGLALCFGVARRGQGIGIPDKLERARLQFSMAFGGCMAKADGYIRDNGNPSEVGVIVAEDSNKIERSLAKSSLLNAKNYAIVLRPEHIASRNQDIEQGFNSQNPELRISRIRDTIHFVKKGEEPLVDVADACAWGFRHFLRQERFTKRFLDAMKIPIRDPELWRQQGGYFCYWSRR